MQVQGYFDVQFEAVRDAFLSLFDNPQERGAAVCIQVAGETVVDLWAGTTDRHGEQAWHSDTLLNVFSCTKPFAAVAAMQLVAAGKLSLDEPLSDVWPELVSGSKAQITLRHLLSHQSGLSAISKVLAPEALYDWDTMCRALAEQQPWWTPGQGHGYAPITYGWLIGEVLRRVEGISPGQAIIQRTAQPLNLDFHIGLADSEFHRVSEIARGKGDQGDVDAQRLLAVMLGEPQSMSSLAFANPPSVMTSTNKPEWRRMEQPAANGHGNARSLAGFYSGLLAGKLIDSAVLEEMTRTQAQGTDRTLLANTRFGLGFMLDQPGAGGGTFGMGAKAFGHPGAGGTLAFADPEREVAFAFATNTLGPYVLMDPRAQKLARAAVQCLN